MGKSAEKFAQRLLHSCHGDESNARESFGVETFQILLGEDEALKTEFLGFGNALGDAGDGADFAAQTAFAGHGHIALNGRVNVGREHGGDNAQVDGRIGNTDAAGDVEKHVLRTEFEAYTLFQNRQQHIEAAQVETGGRALGRAVGGGGNQRLGFDEKGAHPFESGADGHAREGRSPLAFSS